MSCKEAYPIRYAVERHRHLLMGNLPFASVNDHKSLKYIFNNHESESTIPVAARGRLKRWVQYLRSFTFTTVHIPGNLNHVCDFLSRNGCSEVVRQWAVHKEKHSNDKKIRDQISKEQKIVKKQMVIITLREPKGVPAHGKHDLNIKTENLMPDILGGR